MMKKIIFHTAFMFMMSVLCIACKDDDNTTIRPEDIVLDLHAEDFGEEVLITTTRMTNQTRSAIVEEGNELSMKWTDIDSICLFVDNKPYVYKPLVQADSSTVVLISADTCLVPKVEGQKVYAVFCANLTGLTMSNGTVSHNAEFGNVRDLKTSNAQWNYMYASGFIADGKLNLDFKQMFAYVKVSVPSADLANYKYMMLYAQNNIITPTSLEYNIDKESFTDECIANGSIAIYTSIDSITPDKEGNLISYLPVLPSDGTNAFVVAGYSQGSRFNPSYKKKDLYYCDEPEEGIAAGELFYIDTQKGYDTSTNFSNDGKVKILESATKGEGISLVFMGMGFVDSDITSGRYESVMRREMERFFSIEPFCSHRDYFNSYMVYRISKNNNMADYAEFDEDEAWNSALNYAQKAISFQGTDTVARAIVVYNGNYVGRSATMFSAYGHFVSLIMENYPTVICHEAGGHGFAMLADEYVESGYERMRLPEYEKQTLKTFHEDYDAYANADVDAENPIWSKFINNPDYASENLGAYQGAFCYGRGVYRPTQESIMRDHTISNTFNAPSREAIYKRIKRYSDSLYQYDDADFYAYDVMNLSPTAQSPAVRTGQTNASSTVSRHITNLGRTPILKQYQR